MWVGRAVGLVLLVSGCLGSGEDDSLYGCGSRSGADPDSGAVTDAGGSDAVTGIAVVSPNGGEQLVGGEPIEIAWTAESSITAVDVDLLRDGFGVLSIAAAAPNTGSLDWTPPIDLPTADTYRIRVAVSDGTQFDDSDEPFGILNWQYRRDVDATAASALTDFQVLIELDASFDYDHVAADGSDLRFASTADRVAGFDLAYYVETWAPGGASRVWVKIPSIDGTTTVYMFYGAPGVADASSFDGTFPDQFTSADVALTGTQSFDVFRLDAAHTVTVMPGEPLAIDARIIQIDGAIVADGAGFAPGAVGTDGTGPGFGGRSPDAGGGGGGYGGAGGDGSGDGAGAEIEGPGGITYGSATAATIDMGSGGGGGQNGAGGAGGGAVSIAGHTVGITGPITADGDIAGGDQGGGGAGGGILIQGHDVSVSGAISARGGDGGGGGFDEGGGGGGGRIKVLYGRGLDDTATTDVAGGAGPGIAGDPGTVHTAEVAPIEPTVTVGAEQALF